MEFSKCIILFESAWKAINSSSTCSKAAINSNEMNNGICERLFTYAIITYNLSIPPKWTKGKKLEINM